MSGTQFVNSIEQLVPTPGKVLLYDQSLTGTASSINLYPAGNIPPDYKHLEVDISLRTNRAATFEGILLKINSDTGNNYDSYLMFHNYHTNWNDEGQSASGTPNIAYANGNTAPSNEFSSYTIHFYDYAATNKSKFGQSRGGQITARNINSLFIYDSIFSWHPASPVAITKIELLPKDGNSFVAGCRVTLWGLY